jgi:hypothetical protein
MKFVYPLKNESFSSNSGFGQRNNANHTGIDLKANSGTRVLASLPGTVVQSDDANTSYGGYILIKHDLDGETYYTRYAHLRNRYKNFSDKVSAGEQIGESGGASTDRNRGNATGPHLHFELLNDSRQPIDPEPYLKSGEIVVGDNKEENKNKTSTDDTQDNTRFSSVDKFAKDVTKKIMSPGKKLMNLYNPIALAGSLGAGVKTESDIPKDIVEEVTRFKELIK